MMTRNIWTETPNSSSWNPLRTAMELQKEIDRLFGEVTAPAARDSVVPPCDFTETDGHFMLSLDVPGVRKDDIRIEVADRELTVSAERHEERDEREGTRYFTERVGRRFERRFTLPPGIDSEGIEASYENGVLRLALPKSESARPRQIRIQEGRPGLFSRLLGESQSEKRHHDRVA